MCVFMLSRILGHLLRAICGSVYSYLCEYVEMCIQI